MSDQRTTRKEFLTGTAVATGIATIGLSPSASGLSQSQSVLSQPASAAPASKPKEIVVVGSKVKEVIRSAGFQSDDEFVQAVSDKVHELLGAAIKRCKGNKRGTVRPYDL